MTTIAETLASLERLTGAAEAVAAQHAAVPMNPREAVAVMRLRLDIENVRRLADRIQKEAEGLEVTR